MSKAREYAEKRASELWGQTATRDAVITELEMAYMQGAIDAKEKSIEIVQKAFGADFARPIKENPAT